MFSLFIKALEDAKPTNILTKDLHVNELAEAEKEGNADEYKKVVNELEEKKQAEEDAAEKDEETSDTSDEDSTSEDTDGSEGGESSDSSDTDTSSDGDTDDSSSSTEDSEETEDKKDSKEKDSKEEDDSKDTKDSDDSSDTSNDVVQVKEPKKDKDDPPDNPSVEAMRNVFSLEAIPFLDDSFEHTEDEEKYGILEYGPKHIEVQTRPDLIKLGLQIGKGAWEVGKWIGQNAPDWYDKISPHVYKGVAAAMERIYRLYKHNQATLTQMYDDISNTFKGLKEDIAKAKAAVNTLEDPKDPEELTYTNVKSINNLKIGSSLDVNANIQVLGKFVGGFATWVANEARKNITLLTKLSEESDTTDPTMGIKDMMPVTKIPGFTERKIDGYEVESKYVSSLSNNMVLPGDIIVIAALPRPNIELEHLKDAYRASFIRLGLDAHSYKDIQSMKYVTKDKLLKILDSLDKVCDLCIKHQDIYTHIKTTFLRTSTTVKKLFNFLTIGKHRRHLSETNLENIELAINFIFKVYLVACFDIHRYCAKIATHVLKYVKENTSAIG